MYTNDNRIVITLDAGGTNFVFSAIRGNRTIAGPLVKPSNAHDLHLCLSMMVEGFSEVMEQLDDKPVAISFAFPGPADYPDGVIGGFLPNFPSFRDGVALGPFLERHFNIPVFINNDADLFVYGEALAGVLPEINAKLRKLGSDKQYHNLIGFTWGTGFGFGFTVNGNMHIGDNSCCEAYCLPQKNNPGLIIEDAVSIRAIKRVYGEKSGQPAHQLEPYDIFRIAEGEISGDRQAACAAFEEFGENAGEVCANVINLIDGIVVFGGGLTKAYRYIIPSLMKVLKSKIHTVSGDTLGRLQVKPYNLDDDEEFLAFARGDSRKIKIYGSEDTITYDPQKRVGITISKIGASHAVSLGAYAFALNEMDKKI